MADYGFFRKRLISQGTSILNDADIVISKLTYIYNSSSVDITSCLEDMAEAKLAGSTCKIIGPTGPVGSTGPVGIQGIQGIQGVTGPAFCDEKEQEADINILEYKNTNYSITESLGVYTVPLNDNSPPNPPFEIGDVVSLISNDVTIHSLITGIPNSTDVIIEFNTTSTDFLSKTYTRIMHIQESSIDEKTCFYDLRLCGEHSTITSPVTIPIFLPELKSKKNLAISLRVLCNINPDIHLVLMSRKNELLDGKLVPLRPLIHKGLTSSGNIIDSIYVLHLKSNEGYSWLIF